MYITIKHSTFFTLLFRLATATTSSLTQAPSSPEATDTTSTSIKSKLTSAFRNCAATLDFTTTSQYFSRLRINQKINQKFYLNLFF